MTLVVVGEGGSTGSGSSAVWVEISSHEIRFLPLTSTLPRTSLNMSMLKITTLFLCGPVSLPDHQVLKSPKFALEGEIWRDPPLVLLQET